MKYIQNSTERLRRNNQNLTNDDDDDKRKGPASLLEKVISSQNDEKIAIIMALDLILVGIDTVRKISIITSLLYQSISVFSFKILLYSILFFFFLGGEKISMAVCSILYQLATRPLEQEKIHQELKRLLPDRNTPLNIGLMDQMHYLKAFIREVFRMYSTVIGNGRTLQQDTVICGYRIPKGVSE